MPRRKRKEAPIIVKQEPALQQMYNFLPEIANITAAELAQIIAMAGMRVPVELVKALPNTTRRHFRLHESSN